MSEISIIKGSNLPVMPTEDRVLDKLRLFGYRTDEMETVQIKGSEIQKELDKTVTDSSGYPEFNPEEDYFKGQVVSNQGKLYKFKNNHTAGPWDPSDVDPWSLGDEISETNQALAEVVNDMENNYARNQGVYPNLIAGNLVGHGSVSAEYTFRTSAGPTDIGTGAATIDVMKGKTIKFNQMVDSDTTEVTLESGRMYVTIVAGVKSLVSGNGSAISVTGGTDCVIDVTEWGITTLAEFTSLYPLDYYDYTATPVLINNAASGIVTTGFNQWDEQWEVGDINSEGIPISSTTKIRSKNFIQVFASTDYYSNNHTSIIVFYDENKVFISSLSTYSYGYLFTTPPNCRYIKFASYSEQEGTYKIPICINLSWSGYRNGEYEPYEKHTLYFNGENGSLATVTGKKIVDGEPTGESEIVWVDGMKGIGTAFDFGKVDSDGYIRVGNRVFGVVNLGDLTWNMISTNSFATTQPTNTKTGILGTKAKYICPIYETVNTTYDNQIPGRADKSIAGYSGVKGVTIKDTSHSSAPTSEDNWLDGVIMYYELDTPEEYLLDTPIPATYIVNDFGTEQRIPEDTASSVMAPIFYDVKYAMNAVDTLRRLPQNYISAESMTQFLAALGTAMNGTWLMTWDGDNNRYGFSFTENAEPVPDEEP